MFGQGSGMDRHVTVPPIIRENTVARFEIGQILGIQSIQITNLRRKNNFLYDW